MPDLDYSGRWEYLPAASTLEIGAPESVAVTIRHDEPAFRLERTIVFGGVSDTFALDLTIGAAGDPLVRGDATLHPSLRREGDDLVFLTRIVRGGEEATNLVRYRLEADGTRLVAEERFRSAKLCYDNRWVLARRADPAA